VEFRINHPYMQRLRGRFGSRDFRPKGIVVILLLIVWSSLSLFAQSPQTGASPGAGQIGFSESVLGFAPRTNRKGEAVLVRSELTPTESEATIEFSIALKLHDFAALKERIAKNEIISPEEMAAKYFPADTEYTKIAAWLSKQGFTVNLAGKYQLSIFASGTVAQIERAFGTKFGRVTMAGSEYTSALTPPSLPGEIGASVLGINGLQPHLHPRHHFVVAPSLRPGKLVNNIPPYTVSEIAKAYHANGLSANGSGQKIGIVIDTFPSDSDLTTFWANNGVTQTLGNVEKVQTVGGPLPSPSGEETLDVEWSSSLAPGAKVRIYATTDLSFVHLDHAYQVIINELPSQPALRQISMSYGLGELYEAPAQLQTDSQYFATLAAQGVTIFVSSGDGGSTPGPNGFEDNSGPLQVESPACDPSVTAVGGTRLTLNTSTGTVASESAWFYGGGGQSQIFARPPWQTGAGMPAGSGRLVPDVALVADLNTGGYLIFGGQVYTVGGTSWSAPSWAGFCADINQARAAHSLPPLGLLGSKIYTLNPQSGKADFSDIVMGSNGANGFYSAGPGFDLCTGLGVPNVSTLLQVLTTHVAKDFNGDGQSDLVWENTTTGQCCIWIMQNGQWVSLIYLPTVSTQWHLAGVGDFLGNGQSDLVWENTTTGQCCIWIMQNGQWVSLIYLPTVSTEWRLAGAGDFLGTGQADLVWQDTITGQCCIWIMQNGQWVSLIYLPTVSTEWHLAGTGDFLGKGQADLVWQNTATGQICIWIMQNGQWVSLINLPTVNTEWRLAGAGDFLGTGQADLVWEDTITGQCCIWVMQNGQWVSLINLPSVNTEWQIENH
jgi:kumamolisin